MAVPVYGEPERFLREQVRKIVRQRGFRWKEPSAFVLELGAWRKDVGFFHAEVHGDRDLLKMTVEQRVTEAIREAVVEIEERHGDPSYGFRVGPTLALKGAEGWDPSMPDYAVCLMWRGPKPMFWPHKVTAQDVAAAKVTDDEGYDRDYKAVTGETPEEFLRRAREAKSAHN